MCICTLRIIFVGISTRTAFVPCFRPELSLDYDARPHDEMHCQPGPRAWLLTLLCAGSASGLRVAFSSIGRPGLTRSHSRLAPPVMRTNETGVGTSPKVGTTGDFGTSALQRYVLANQPGNARLMTDGCGCLP